MNRYSSLIRKVPPDFVLAAVDVWLGFTFLLQNSQRQPKTGIYLIAISLMSMRVWGALFLFIGTATLYVSFLNHYYRGRMNTSLARTSVAWIQIGGPALYAAWAMMAFLSALLSPHASFSTAALYAFLAYRHSFAPDMPNAGNRHDSGAPWSRMS